MASFTVQKTISGTATDVVEMTLTPSDFTDGIWLSDEIDTQNDTSVKLEVRYDDLTPDGADTTVDFRILATLQGERDDGGWEDLVSHQNAYFRTEQAPEYRLIAEDTVSEYNPGEEITLTNALQQPSLGITHVQTPIPNKVRVCVELGDVNTTPPNAALTSFKLTLTGNKK